MTIAELEREIGHVKTRADVLETENVILKERNRLVKDIEAAHRLVNDTFMDRLRQQAGRIAELEVEREKLEAENAALWKALEEKP